MALPDEEPEFMNLREWDRRARFIRENPTSRRFSASYVGSFREDYNKSSSRTNVNNSTASSPGYTLKEIDPSTYSFTNALKALQAKTMYNKREWLPQEGFALNSKWNEAEKYICNPLSGEVPMECLSSKTLRARSFRNLTTMSAPLHYPKPNPLTKIYQNKTNDNHNVRVIHGDLYALDPVLVRAKEKVVGLKLDVGIKSSSVDSNSGSPSPAETPPIMERSLKRYVEPNGSPVDFNLKLEGQPEDLKLAENEKEEEKHEMSKKDEEKKEMSKEQEEKKETSKEKGEEEQKMISEEEEEKMEKNKKRGSGCFSWVRSRQRQARKSKYIPDLYSSFCQRLLKKTP
ncbi:Mental retardation GTPase activating protein [Hirschfeldia incana]|nr:Mental retardation GTPase activating protein [Hirschfeldia incana]